MLGLLEQIMKQTMDRISSQILAYTPGLLAALFILAISFAIAKIYSMDYPKDFQRDIHRSISQANGIGDQSGKAENASTGCENRLLADSRIWLFGGVKLIRFATNLSNY